MLKLFTGPWKAVTQFLDRNRLIRLVFLLLLALYFAVLFLLSTSLSGTPDKLDIFAGTVGFTQAPSAQAASQTAGSPAASNTPSWSICGIVTDEKGEPAEQANVWAVAYDNQGRTFISKNEKTDPDGRFTISDLSANHDLSAPEAKEIRILARQSTDRSAAKHGEVTIDMAKGTRSVNWRDGQGFLKWFVGLLIIFALSLVVAFYPPGSGADAKAKYYTLTAMTVAFAGLMTYVTVVGLVWLYTSVLSANQGRTIGFLNFFQGRYVNGQAPEWVVSLTAPGATGGRQEIPMAELRSSEGNKSGDNKTSDSINTKTGDNTEARVSDTRAGPEMHGFGAPLWVLPLSVVGATMFTLRFVANEVRRLPEFQLFDSGGDAGDRAGLTRRLQDTSQRLVQYQLFIVFAPVVAIFVYQTLVLGGAASQPLTVAVAMLGAGLAFDYLLQQAAAEGRRPLQSPRKQRVPGVETETGGETQGGSGTGDEAGADAENGEGETETEGRMIAEGKAGTGGETGTDVSRNGSWMTVDQRKAQEVAIAQLTSLAAATPDEERRGRIEEFKEWLRTIDTRPQTDVKEQIARRLKEFDNGFVDANEAIKALQDLAQAI